MPSYVRKGVSQKLVWIKTLMQVHMSIHQNVSSCLSLIHDGIPGGPIPDGTEKLLLAFGPQRLGDLTAPVNMSRKKHNAQICAFAGYLKNSFGSPKDLSGDEGKFRRQKDALKKAGLLTGCRKTLLTCSKNKGFSIGHTPAESTGCSKRPPARPQGAKPPERTGKYVRRLSD